MKITRTITAVLIAAGLAACDSQPEPAKPPAPKTAPSVAPDAAKPATVRPTVDPQVLARGEQVFKQNCAVCHGDRAQGAPNWEKPGPDGKYPPPPLDGSAHAWHHPRAGLVQVIKQGTQKIGGNMPPWQGKLSDAEIDAVILYFQSLWSDEIYAAWKDIDARQNHR